MTQASDTARSIYGDQHQVLALSLRSLPVGMAYAIWSGIDTFGLRLQDIICMLMAKRLKALIKAIATLFSGLKFLHH